MTRLRAARLDYSGTLIPGAALLLLTAQAWVLTLRAADTMTMPGSAPSLGEGTLFTLQWGVMMAAMMLPSAAPMILLYRTVSLRLRTANEAVLPVALFAAVYLLLWLLLGVPVYGGYVATAALAARWPAFDAAMPYAVAGVLVLAGLYQFTDAKRVCLRHCESPLGFLMRRWRSGYAGTFRLAAEHAGYCIGCCWGLMLILVAAGAMSIAWVVLIAVAVFAEKVLPHGWRTARLIGVGLIALGLAVAIHPSLVSALRPHPAPMPTDMPMDMPMPTGHG